MRIQVISFAIGPWADVACGIAAKTELAAFGSNHKVATGRADQAGCESKEAGSHVESLIGVSAKLTSSFPPDLPDRGEREQALRNLLAHGEATCVEAQGRALRRKLASTSRISQRSGCRSYEE